MVVKCDICYSLPEKLYQLEYGLGCSHRALNNSLFLSPEAVLGNRSGYYGLTTSSQHHIHILVKGKVYSCSLPHVATKETGNFSLSGQPCEERKNRHCALPAVASDWDQPFWGVTSSAFWSPLFNSFPFLAEVWNFKVLKSSFDLEEKNWALVNFAILKCEWIVNPSWELILMSRERRQAWRRGTSDRGIIWHWIGLQVLKVDDELFFPFNGCLNLCRQFYLGPAF